ncbi:MAG TPA: hypothetical protein VIV27_00495 [Halioglobus sp.]
MSLSGLFFYSNEHLTVIPQLLYWLNIKLFAGSNIALGLIDVGVVLGTVAFLGLMVRELYLDRTVRLAIFTLSVAILFGLSGAWNFIYGMSGAAWLSANLFVVAAVYFRGREKYWAAAIAAVFATASYGTGIFVWPSIIAVGVAQRHFTEWWREWPFVVAFLVAITLVSNSTDLHPQLWAYDYLLIGRMAADFLGNSIGLSAHWAQAAGWVALVGTPACAIYLAFFARLGTGASWIGVAAYAWSSLLIITQGRAMLWDGTYPGRYYSIGALVWLGFSVLLILAVKNIDRVQSGPIENGDTEKRWWSRQPWAFVRTIFPYVLVVPLTLSGIMSAGPELEKRDLGIHGQELKEIALQLDAVDGSVGYMETLPSSNKQFDSTRHLRLHGHYPFVNDWNLDCGLLGQRLSSLAPRRMGGKVDNVVPVKRLESVNRIGGIIPDPRMVNGTIRCILLTDSSGLVVGVGVPQQKPDGNKNRSFIALARRIEGDYKVVFFDDGPEPILARGR